MPAENGSFGPAAHHEIAISLDGIPVEIPAAHASLSFIRCHLETLALEKQHVLCAFNVDGRATSLTLPLTSRNVFSCIEAESVSLDGSEILLLKTALQQAQYLRECVETALTLVLINKNSVARGLWWELAHRLKEPVVTLSLLPNQLGSPAGGQAPLRQLRKWQLEQLAIIIREVDSASETGDTLNLSNALESRVLPWLQQLCDLIRLRHETAQAAARLAAREESL